MKRLIICCDGTWNNPKQEDNGIPAPTNVVKLFNAIADSDGDVSQLKYYHPGVGGEEIGLKEKILGGALGVGITRHICSAYHWLANNYEEGDDIYLYGFSRGAFTARSVGGMLSKGLLDLREVDSDTAWQRVNTAFMKGYRKKQAKKKWVRDDWKFFHDGNAMPIRFIGVWDTVGALGIPNDLEILNLFDERENWQFHDTKLGNKVRTARHAMAIDEIRSSFSVTQWTNANNHKDVKQLWFPGVHADVGGGYAECDLSNGALKWMIEESAETELVFRDGVMDQIRDNPLGIMHNSYKGAFARLRSRPRNVPALVQENHDAFHDSALERHKISPIEYPAYRPTKLLKKGEKFKVEIYADTRWNATSVYLGKGEKYKFSASGKWQDSKDSCDWKGTEDGKFTAGDLVRSGSSILGAFEDLFKKVSKNESSDFFMTKRVESMPWFVLVGAIANDSGLDKAVYNDGSAAPHQYVQLPDYENKTLTIEYPGYLYCFPNDVWALYDNNHGSIHLTIERVS